MSLIASGVVALAVTAGASPAKVPRNEAIAGAAHLILQYQRPDGAIAMDKAAASQTRVIPYVANYAAQGLVEAYTITREARLLDAARSWILWYEGHMTSDGTVYDHTGVPGSWKPTGDYDSTDSYAATYLDLVWKMQEVAPDVSWLRARAPSVLRAVGAIRLTLQPNGLTIAKPKWPVMYTMDNTETALGLRAASRIATALGERPLAKQCAQLARRMETAIGADLWDPRQQCYRIGLQTDGTPIEGLTRWYPGVMANLMAVAWLPSPSRNGALYGRLKARFGHDLPDRVVTREDLDRLVWWALAARGADDEPLGSSIAARFIASMDAVERLAEPDALGHICRTLAGRRSPS